MASARQIKQLQGCMRNQFLKYWGQVKRPKAATEVESVVWKGIGPHQFFFYFCGRKRCIGVHFYALFLTSKDITQHKPLMMEHFSILWTRNHMKWVVSMLF